LSVFVIGTLFFNTPCLLATWHKYFVLLIKMRKPRIIVQGASYHTCARINRQEMIFEDKKFKMMFLDVVAQAKQKYKFKFRNFCIMGNHVHLDIEPINEITISKIMQWILSVFALRYNRMYNYKGHVWYDRFKSKAITSVRQLINTFIYIACNPVRAGIVKHPLEFAFSGLTFHKINQMFYKDLLDPPEKKLMHIVDNFLKGFDRENHLRIIPEHSFTSKKPRKSKQLP